MTFHKYVMISMVLFCGSALLLGCGEDDPAAPTTVDTAPPSGISGLNIRMLSGGDVELRWDANTELNQAVYNVYRHVKSEQEIGKIATTIKMNHYIDRTTSPGPVYEYFVTAVNAQGQESVRVSIWIDTSPSKSKGESFED